MREPAAALTGLSDDSEAESTHPSVSIPWDLKYSGLRQFRTASAVSSKVRVFTPQCMIA